jgi:GTP-binding protein EngB required for normal cell division
VTDALDARLAALADAASLADGRLDDELVTPAGAVLAKAGVRLGLGVETTVVALAGPTGAGKSSLFNALAAAELASVGRRRPTTSAAAAATWGGGGTALLDWLEVPRRHRIEDADFDGLVLLDLPDFDSVERGHRLEVDRLVELVDLVVWVVDPQKYADAAWHDGYLRRLARHGEAMTVVLNQADLLDPDALAACLADLTRLLEQDGLRGVPVLAVSAATGAGLTELRGLLAERVAAREAVAARLAADVDAAAAGFAAACDGSARKVEREARARLLDALEEAAGVPTVLSAVEQAHRRRGALATGWPFARWIRRLRPDPLRRLRLGDDAAESVHTSLPPASAVQVARVENAARSLAATAASGLPEPWPALARAAATRHEPEVAAELDRAVAGADLHVRRPRWWRLADVLQTGLAAAVAIGVLWLLALLALDYLRLDDVLPMPEARGVPLPTALLLGGAAGGIALAFLTRLVNGAGARRRSRAAKRSLRKRLESAAETLVLAPLEHELDAYARFCSAVAAAQASRPSTAPKSA